MKYILLILLSFPLLVGCEATTFGVPTSTYQTLTPEQQSQVIDSYNRQQEIEKQNEPLMNAVNTVNSIYDREQRNRIEKENKEKVYVRIIKPDGTTSEVRR